MSLFFWKKNKVIDMFANELANELFSTIQPDAASQYLTSSIDNKDTRKARKKIDAQIDNIIKRVQQFRTVNSLGVYGKARFHLKFTERLEDLGYETSIAKKINEHIMLKTP